MTEQEYAEIAKEISDTFPEVAQFFREHGTPATAQRNHDCLIDRDSSDVRKAIRKLSMSPVDPWPTFALLGRCAAIIAEASGEFRESRRNAAMLAELQIDYRGMP